MTARSAALGLGLAAVAVFAATVAAVWPFTVDDAFITLRYARNLAAGHGPTFNAGLPPVEGCTAFLWMVLLALPHLLGLDAPSCAKLAGVAALLATLGATALLAFELSAFLPRGQRALPAAAAALILAAWAPSAVHAVSGMETALFSFLLVLLALLCARRLGRPAAPGVRGLALTALLLGLTRPEGNLAAAAALLATLGLSPHGARAPLARAAA
ncbi:MAG: hypothetical protein HZC42_07565, partial [Candidatus Eisenbacteria bacterium]|nr:hypothetical protein [Candidatus Eisenbacteria bacterium]